MTIQGKLHKKFDTVQIKETFKKREFVIEYNDGNPMYPQYVLFQLVQDKCGLIDNFQEGTELSVDFNLRGRSWEPRDGGETKYFNSLDAWRVSEVQQAVSQGTGSTPPPPPLDSAIDVESMNDDDLPF